MDKLDKTYADARTSVMRARKDSVGLRLIAYLLAFVIGGAVVCIILGIIKTAADILVIVGCVLLVIALLIMWAYHSTRAHITEKKYRQLLAQKENAGDNQIKQ